MPRSKRTIQSQSHQCDGLKIVREQCPTLPIEPVMSLLRGFTPGLGIRSAPRNGKIVLLNFCPFCGKNVERKRLKAERDGRTETTRVGSKG